MFASRKSLAVRLAQGALCAAALALFAAPVLAAEMGMDAGKERVPASYHELQGMKPMDAMHAMDPEGKGYVTKEEFLKFQERIFESMDRDRDQRLSAVEFGDRG